MFEGLQKKWKVSAGRLAIILVTFAVGGSLTGYTGKKLMQLTGIENNFLYIIIYVILVTILWPFMVLLVSIPFGQFSFFKNYIGRIGKKLQAKRSMHHAIEQDSNENSVLQEIRNPKSEIRNSEFTTPNPKPQTPNSIVIFASGTGSNAQKIIDHFRYSPLARVKLIVCNKQGAGITKIAENENIPLLMIEKQRFFQGDGYVPELKAVNAELIVLAGFLLKIPDSLIKAYPGRIINIHPALLPKFGGKGMYGLHVHQAVLDAGDTESGITIHYVDEHYDNGDVIFQSTCPVLESDTAESLAARIHKLEHEHFAEVVEKVIRLK